MTSPAATAGGERCKAWRAARSIPLIRDRRRENNSPSTDAVCAQNPHGLVVAYKYASPPYPGQRNGSDTLCQTTAAAGSHDTLSLSVALLQQTPPPIIYHIRWRYFFHDIFCFDARPLRIVLPVIVNALLDEKRSMELSHENRMLMMATVGMPGIPH